MSRLTRLAVGAAIPVVTLAALLLPGTAHADYAHYGYQGDSDAYAYRDELRYQGLHHEDARNANDLAFRLCSERAQGYTGYQVLAHLDASPDG